MSGNAYTLPESELERLLAEDAPCGDATTFALGIGDRPGRLVFRARQAMVVCASEEARRMGELHGLHSVGEFVPSGSRLAAGETILTLEGTAAGNEVLTLTVTATATARDCYVPPLVEFGRVPLAHIPLFEAILNSQVLKA